MPAASEAAEARRSLDRLLPRLEQQFGARGDEWTCFRERLDGQFPSLFAPLLHLYGGRYDFFYYLESALATAARMWFERPADLKELDVRRAAEPDWFLGNDIIGAVCYVDLFAGNLDGVRRRIPYFQELGIRYLHLMPLFATPEGNSDGGYAIADYRTVEPALGTMADLSDLAADLRAHDISLVLDFVFNHTADTHRWAQFAIAGDPEYQNFYYLFPDRTMPDAYEQTLREIFPEEHPGSFTYREDIDRWVWTTFHSFQWDLNYGNPAVFIAMAEEMLFLANAGAEILRLDALAFVWKRLGTPSENLPEAHDLIRAFNAMARLAAPSLLFKSEAIVHPDEVIRYIGPRECRLSYNPLLMALLWEALATRETRLLIQSLSHRFALPPGCAWVNYVRSHDDIGWTFDDADASELGINGYDHRRFLNDFYTGRFPGSFARGLAFQENPRTGDARISGTAASLAGLENALHAEDQEEIELSIRRLTLIYGIAFSIGGIPLLYLGDELGTTNAYGYVRDPEKAADSRWAHRPATDWSRAQQRTDPETIEGRVYERILRLIKTRIACAALSGEEMHLIATGNPHVFGYLRHHGGDRLLVLANFSEHQQQVTGNVVRMHGPGYRFTDALSGSLVPAEGNVTLEPYDLLWLLPQG